MDYSLLKKTIKDSRVTFRECAQLVNMTEAGLRRAIDCKTLTIEVFEKLCNVLNVCPSIFFDKTHNFVINGTQNQISTGNGDQILMTPDQREIESLKELLKEKERFIQHLLNQNK